jgi:hypothetical protein
MRIRKKIQDEVRLDSTTACNSLELDTHIRCLLKFLHHSILCLHERVPFECFECSFFLVHLIAASNNRL